MATKPAQKNPPAAAKAARTTIAVQGARVHNLKNISVEIPRDKLTVVVEHTDSGFLQRDVEANNLAHGSLRSNGGRLRA